MGGVLKNPHRRKILKLLPTRKAATPKEISEELNIGDPDRLLPSRADEGLRPEYCASSFSASLCSTSWPMRSFVLSISILIIAPQSMKRIFFLKARIQNRKGDQRGQNAGLLIESICDYWYPT